MENSKESITINKHLSSVKRILNSKNAIENALYDLKDLSVADATAEEINRFCDDHFSVTEGGDQTVTAEAFTYLYMSNYYLDKEEFKRSIFASYYVRDRMKDNGSRQKAERSISIKYFWGFLVNDIILFFNRINNKRTAA